MIKQISTRAAAYINQQREKWNGLLYILLVVLAGLVSIAALNVALYGQTLSAQPAFSYVDPALVGGAPCTGDPLVIAYTVASEGRINATTIYQTVQDEIGQQITELPPVYRPGAAPVGSFSVRITTTAPIPALAPGNYTYGRIAVSDVVSDPTTGETRRVIASLSVPFRVVDCSGQ